MFRNVKGGNKGKKIKRCRTTNTNQKIRFASEGEMYARVTSTYGHGMAEVLCEDGKARLLIIRKKVKGRNKRDNIVSLHSVLLVGKRPWEVVAEKKKEKVDLLFVYSKENIVQLKKKNDINRIIFGEKEEDNIVEFDRNFEEPVTTLNQILEPNAEKQETEEDWLNEMIDDI